MLINNIQSTFVYNGGSELDLMNAPELSDAFPHELYIDYHNFINTVLAIYGNQRSDDRIPVFWTKQQVNDSSKRVPDQDSTLRSLVPGNVYYVVCSNNTVLPLKIPQTINAKEFIKTKILLNINSIHQNCDNVLPVSTEYRNINLSKESGSLYPINIDITGLLPNNNYFFTIDPIFSNWPANVTQFSGYLERGGPTGLNGLTSASIKTIFSYESCSDISSCTGNIPYSSIETDNNYFYNNIFSILKVNLYDESSKLIFNDTINIVCNNCLPILDNTLGQQDPPSVKINQSQTELTTNNHTTITAMYNKINPYKNYTYNFESLGANWPCRIRNISGSFTPEHVYKDTNGKIYGSGNITSVFTFANTSNITDMNWSNLEYSLEDYSDEEFIKNNIYAVLQLNIKDGQEVLSSTSTTIRCSDCLSPEQDCSQTVININNTNTNFNNALTDTSRPGSEITVEYSCCDQDQDIYVDISGACCETLYSYEFTSYPTILISPSTGSFSFSSDNGRISAVANLNGNSSTVIKFTAKHSGSNSFSSDSILMRCRPVTITVSGLIADQENFTGQYRLSNTLDSNNSYFWSKDGSDSWPRIWNPGSSLLPPPSDQYWFMSTGISDILYHTTGNKYPNAPFSLYWITPNADSIPENQEIITVFNRTNLFSWENGNYIKYTGTDIQNNQFYSKDGQDTWPRIYRPGSGILNYHGFNQNDFGDKNLLWWLSELPPNSGLTVPATPPMPNSPNQGFDFYLNSGIYPLLPLTTGLTWLNNTGPTFRIPTTINSYKNNLFPNLISSGNIQ